MDKLTKEEAWTFIRTLFLFLLIGFLFGAGYGKEFASNEIKKELSKMGVECYDGNKTKILYFPKTN